MIDDNTPGINVYRAGEIGPAVVIGRQGFGEFSTAAPASAPVLPPLVLTIPAAPSHALEREAS